MFYSDKIMIPQTADLKYVINLLYFRIQNFMLIKQLFQQANCWLLSNADPQVNSNSVQRWMEHHQEGLFVFW